MRKVFDEMPRRTVASWNSVMTTIVSLGDGIMYFFRMWGYAFEPDETCSHPFIYFFYYLPIQGELSYISLSFIPIYC